MKTLLSTITLLSCLAAFAGNLHSSPPLKMASEVMEPFDPKKKKAGEECKTSDECQKHHTCKQDGEKSVCTAPPRRSIPPGAVT